MFGWEFPPHISGGLGTACAGLVRALEKERVDLLFAIPKLHGGEHAEGTTFINASSIPIRQKIAVTTQTPRATGTSAHPSLSRKFTERNIVTRHGTTYTRIEVPSTLTAYASASENLAPGLRHWNYTFSAADKKSATARDTYPADDAHQHEIQTKYVKEPFAFSGTYGRDLLKEVERYGQVAGEIARNNRFDVIHAHDWMTYPAGILAKKISGKPLIVHVHATEVDRSGAHVNPAVFEIEKQGMLQADRVVTVSNWTKNIAVRHYKIDANKIEVVHNGISPKESAEKPSAAPPWETPIVTFLGRITHQKGPMYFVEAARQVHAQFPDVHFVVAGSGDQLPQMIERIAQLRMSGHFHFTGFLKADDIDRIWALSTMYVMPSVSEPFGIAPLEAIQAGVPVILSRQAGVSEVMPHAIKVDFWDSQALAEAICNLLRFKSLANTLKKNGSEEIKTITWEKAAKKITTLYYELTTKQKRRKKSRVLLSGTPTPQASQPSVL